MMICNIFKLNIGVSQVKIRFIILDICKRDGLLPQPKEGVDVPVDFFRDVEVELKPVW